MKVYFYLVLSLLTILFASNISTVYAVLDNAEQTRPIIDSGLGYGEAPAPKKKNLLNESKDVVTDIWQILNIDRSQLVDPTPTVIPTVPQQNDTGNVPTYYPSVPSTTAEGIFADRVVAIVRTNCFLVTNNGYETISIPGIITSANVTNCAKALASILNASALWELTVSALPYRYVQCVGCVRAMAAARNRPYNGIGNAKQHAGQRISGYTYYANGPQNWPQLVPGSIFVITDDAYGHVGYVTDVQKDSSGVPYSFKAFECNWGAYGLVRHDKVRDIKSITGWQKPNNL